MAKKAEEIQVQDNNPVEKGNKKKQLVKSETIVYCGPSIRGVLQQYAHFTKGVPKHVKTYLETHQHVKRLLVSMDKFIETNKNIHMQGTIEHITYNKILKGE